MKNKPTPPASQLKGVKTYINLPLINPEHGQLTPFTWTTDADPNADVDMLTPRPLFYEEEAPILYLQVTHAGEIRGATHDCYERDNYFYVAGDLRDLEFLDAFANNHPDLTPVLSELMLHRKLNQAKFMMNYVGGRHNDGVSMASQFKLK